MIQQRARHQIKSCEMKNDHERPKGWSVGWNAPKGWAAKAAQLFRDHFPTWKPVSKPQSPRQEQKPCLATFQQSNLTPNLAQKNFVASDSSIGHRPLHSCKPHNQLTHPWLANIYYHSISASINLVPRTWLFSWNGK